MQKDSTSLAGDRYTLAKVAAAVRDSGPAAAPCRAVEPGAFRDGMRRLAGAVCVIATGEPGARAGLTATAVCSVTAEPPRILVCINAKTGAHAPIAANGLLSVNVLRSNQAGLAKRFAGMVPGVSGEARFAEGNWSALQGVPVLDDACAVFACRVVEVLPASTHSIFMCEVVAVRTPTPAQETLGREGLLYLDGHFRHPHVAS